MILYREFATIGQCDLVIDVLYKRRFMQLKVLFIKFVISPQAFMLCVCACVSDYTNVLVFGLVRQGGWVVTSLD